MVLAVFGSTSIANFDDATRGVLGPLLIEEKFVVGLQQDVYIVVSKYEVQDSSNTQKHQQMELD